MGIIIIACGIIIYFIFREWARQHYNRLPFERLTAEQIAELGRAELEARPVKRSTAGFKIWSLRVALPVLCGSIMFLVGVFLYVNNVRRQDNAYSDAAELIAYTLTAIGAAVGLLVDFIIELWLIRKGAHTKEADN